MRFHPEESSMPVCTAENVPLFVMYVKKELPEEQTLKLEHHFKECSDCKINCLYTKEILQLKHPLSCDEKTLLLKYLTDPLWYYAISNAKKQILFEVKELIQENKPNSIKKLHFASKTPDKTIDNQNYIKNIFQQYTYFIVTVLMISSITLGYFSYATITNKSFNLSSKYSLSSLSIIEGSNTPFIENSSDFADSFQENILYKQLDTNINEYLTTKDNFYLKQSKTIAQELQNKYQENYGVDLVKYYETVPIEQLSKLSLYREQMLALLNETSGNNFEKRLKESQTLESKFLELGNTIEAYRIKTISNKMYTFLRDYKQTKITANEGLKFSIDNNYLLLQGYFLLWQTNFLSEEVSLEESEKAFQEIIKIGEKIKIYDFVSRPKLSLATLYHLNNEDQKSLEMVQNLLNNSEKMKKERIISLMQLAGLASSNLKHYELSKYYLKESIRLAKNLNNSNFSSDSIARSYTYLSLVSAELKNFSDSEEYHLKSINEANRLVDNTNRLNTIFLISGYYGKTKLLAGDLEAAAKIYQDSLSMFQELKLKNNLELSQLNEGLAIALKELNKIDEAEKYFATANQYRKLAENNKEIANCFLSFVPNPCQIN
ncbi:MAG: tetratricopeptide repeat protein [Acidobacteria bacterium]|nr:tetratricopeptide repeat protein [Acidobacteriota bacterium]